MWFTQKRVQLQSSAGGCRLLRMNALVCRFFLKLGIAPWCALSAAVLLPLAFSADSTLAQELKPVADKTLGAESSVVTPTSPQADRIDGGAIRGANLFHSFSQFNIGEGREAYFANPNGIENILSRVTGSDASRIFGKLGVLGNANLFLINPNGIIFGKNASLDLRGSFVASTASSLKFADGTEFSAKGAQSKPLLTVSVPLGLQFGTDSGKILVQGSGNSLSQDPQINASGIVIGTTLNRSTRPVGLQVPPDKTLALVGGDVMLEGGNLTATSGRIELGSIAGTNFVSLNPIDKGWALGYQGVQNFGNIQLSQAASVDVSGTGGGDIQVRGRRITLTDGSVIAASTLGAKPGGTLTVAADDAMELTGTDSNYQISSSLLTETLNSGSAGDITISTDKLIVRDGAQVASTSISSGAAGKLNVSAPKSVELVGTGNVVINAVGSLEIPSTLASTPTGTGRGGNVTIATNKLSAISGAQIGSVTFGTGDAGNLVVNAKESVELIGISADGQFPSALGTSVQLGATGAGGSLTLETGRLSVRDGAQIQTTTFGIGDAGNSVVNAKQSVELIGISVNGQGFSALSTSTQPGATGASGNLTLETGRLSVRDGAVIQTTTFGTGDAGNLQVNAKESVELIGRTPNGRFSSSLATSTERGATGSGGNLTLETGRLSVRDGAVIQAATFGTGAAGNLVVNAKESVELIGTSANGQTSSGLFTSVQPGATGSGGNLTLETGRLSIRDGAQIGSSTLGSGSAGILIVNAKELVELIGISANGQRPSLLTARTTSSGNASNINIETGKLTVRDGARVSVSSEGSGSAGNLSVQARSIQLDNKGAIIATTRSGNGGDITLQTQDLLLLRRDSQISTTAGTEGAGGNGGNITINTPNGFILAVPRENSDITANAFTGTGGRVDINSFGIYGIQPRQKPTSLSDITASSEFGVNGTVQLNTPDIDLNSALINLPSVPVDTKLAQGCNSPNYAKSSFIITGRGGLPPNPKDILTPDAVQVDWVTLNPNLEKNSSTNISTNPNPTTPAPIVEATGWVFGPKGEVIFTAQAPTQHQSSWQTPPKCHEK
ncbi:filamentous hemagglutinin N-terminal domain-containing protein [Brasilonema bromeliae]|uniref:S-layer family protein n=1 Tax=Brasilonema bromeliae SPC951 TaxID=385972 RepID=A0ABX1P793_9CYAN|nr:S-layer family protein [Brasilonema bromeliae]NMG20164.1 S-layer family protein [Brasilonema bromeliae SPC951]